MQPIEIPRTNSNDDMCVLLEWRYESGQEVRAEEVLACLETSKATEDLLSPGMGILHRLAIPGEEYAAGSCIGYLFASQHERQRFLAEEQTQSSTQPSSCILSEDARELASRHGISEDQLASLGKRFVKKADVQRLLHVEPAPRQESQSSPDDRHQAIIAKRVTQASQTIPHAFAAIKVYTDHALQIIAEYIENEHLLIGLAEILIKVLGDLQKDYSAFYQAEELGAGDGGVGITLDVGTGLFIPVIKSPATRTLGEIAEDIATLRLKAVRRSLREEDLSGGQITISLHTEQDIVAALPIIFPTQRSILSLCSQQEEVYLDTGGQVAVRHYVTIGVTYDHRFINGAQAMRFLAEIKRRYEHGEELMGRIA